MDFPRRAKKRLYDSPGFFKVYFERPLRRADRCMPSGRACHGADGAAAATGRSSRRGAVAGRRADGGRRADDTAGHCGMFRLQYPLDVRRSGP